MTDQSQRSTAEQSIAGVDRRRRGILAAMFGSLLGVGLTTLGTVGGLWTAGFLRFLSPNAANGRRHRFKVGFASDYPAEYVETRYREPCGVWIVSRAVGGKREIVALRTACTHLGCITLWNESQRKFQCPCHGSGFLADGRNVEGPAPRPLERCAIRVADDGHLEVDNSKTFQHELGQWSDPDSFVLL
jgi:cytochrome b6-f complex iron-sulfur subunit